MSDKLKTFLSRGGLFVAIAGGIMVLVSGGDVSATFGTAGGIVALVGALIVGIKELFNRPAE